MRKIFLNSLTMAVILGCIGIVRADLNDGLIAYYPFDGNAKDVSGNDYDGTVYGASLIEDRFGNSNKAYNFDGNDKIVVDALKNFYWGTNLSVSVWFKRTGQWENYQGIVNNGYLDNGSWEIRIAANDNGTILGGGVVTAENPKTWDVWGLYASQNEWHHAVLIYNGSNLSFYLDGEAQAINPHSNNNAPPDIGGIITKNNPLTIGQAGYGKNNEYFFGSIDDIRIYSNALTDTEIQELYNEGSAPNEEEPETPVATLSESLSIHIPELDYQIHHGETSKLDIYLSPAPSIEDRLTWKLENFSNVVCSSTGNNCSNNFQAAIASSDEVEENVPFDIHIPRITYNGNHYWANLEFFGISNGNYLWQLGQFNVSEENNSSTCNFPYPSIWSFDGLTPNPTCKQRWDLYNYLRYGTPMLREEFNASYTEVGEAEARQQAVGRIAKITQTTMEFMSFKKAITNGVEEEIANQFATLVVNNMTRYVPQDSLDMVLIFKVKEIITTAALTAANTGTSGLSPSDMIKEAITAVPDFLNTLYTFYTAYRINNLVEDLNTVNLANRYLVEYYKRGGLSYRVAEDFTGNSSASLEGVIPKIAEKLDLENKWYGDDYDYNKTVELINHYSDNVIKDITQLTITN